MSGDTEPLPLRLGELNRVQAAAIASEAVVVVPVGACEQHGPHLPLGTDTMLITHIAETVAVGCRNAGSRPVVVAPVMPIGYSAYHLNDGVTLSIGIETMTAVLTDVLRSLVASGFRNVFILNGHGGNTEIVKVAVRAAASFAPGLRLGAGSYWEMAERELDAATAGHVCMRPGHAGCFETSAVLGLRPDLVASPPTDVAGQPPASSELGCVIEDRAAWSRISPDGYTDSPSTADVEYGKRVIEAVVAGVVRTLGEAFPPR